MPVDLNSFMKPYSSLFPLWLRCDERMRRRRACRPGRPGRRTTKSLRVSVGILQLMLLSLKENSLFASVHA